MVLEIQLTNHTPRRTPHGNLRSVKVFLCLPVVVGLTPDVLEPIKSRLFSDAKVFCLMTAAMHDNEYTLTTT